MFINSYIHVCRAASTCGCEFSGAGLHGRMPGCRRVGGSSRLPPVREKIYIHESKTFCTSYKPKLQIRATLNIYNVEATLIRRLVVDATRSKGAIGVAVTWCVRYRIHVRVQEHRQIRNADERDREPRLKQNHISHHCMLPR